MRTKKSSIAERGNSLEDKDSLIKTNRAVEKTVKLFCKCFDKLNITVKGINTVENTDQQKERIVS